MFLQKSKHHDHGWYHVIYNIQGVFQSDYGCKSFSILIYFENFEIQKHNEISKKPSFKVMLDQGTDNTETSNQINISAASSSKQKDKTKKTNQVLKRSSIQTETQ